MNVVKERLPGSTQRTLCYTVVAFRILREPGNEASARLPRGPTAPAPYAARRGHRYNAGMDNPTAGTGIHRCAPAVALALAAFVVGLQSHSPVHAQTSPPAVGTAQATNAPARDDLTWTFDGVKSPAGGNWTAERGTFTPVGGEARLQPDANRRVILLSPPGLPEAARNAEEFVLGVTGTGLTRVRVQGRRDARGGWITLADARGDTLREVAGGYAVKRKPGARGAPIERLRIELEFRTTNPRGLQRIAVVVPPG